MRHFAIFPILLVVLAVVDACARQQKPLRAVSNPMPVIWSGIRADIDKLEKSRGSYSEWVNHAEDHRALDDEKSVREALQPTTLNDDEMGRIVSNSARDIRTELFGFEGNYHALVNFGDDGRSTHVVKW